MNQIAPLDTKHSRALETIRRTICLASPDEELVLHETALTEQFGMSRTPIRQILQRLSYERLVETRSGVGTVVVALDPVHRNRDLLVHRGILQSVLSLDVPNLSISQHSDIMALSGTVMMAEDANRELLFDLRHKLHNLLSCLIPDPILLDAFSASYWRIVRWHMYEATIDRSRANHAMRSLVKQLAEYEPRLASDLFRRVAAGEFS